MKYVEDIWSLGADVSSEIIFRKCRTCVRISQGMSEWFRVEVRVR